MDQSFHCLSCCHFLYYFLRYLGEQNSFRTYSTNFTHVSMGSSSFSIFVDRFSHQQCTEVDIFKCQDIQILRSQLRSTCVIYPLGKSVFPQYALVCICKYSNPTVTICSRHRVIRRFNFSQIIPTIDLWLNTRLVYDLYLKSIEGPWIVDRL